MANVSYRCFCQSTQLAFETVFVQGIDVFEDSGHFYTISTQLVTFDYYARIYPPSTTYTGHLERVQVASDYEIKRPNTLDDRSLKT